MHAKDVIRNSLELSDNVVQSYLKDLSDADLLLRPVPGMNHIAWQLGHLIATERHFVEAIRPGSCPPLPDGHDAGHGRKATTENDPAKYYPLAKYKDLWAAQRAATKAVLDGLGDADLDRVEPKFPPFAQTVGAALNLCGTHPLMHA